MKFQTNSLPQSMDVMTEDVSVHANCLLSLPTEVLIAQLSFVGVNDVRQSVKFACKSLFDICDSQPLWYEFCKQTGKLNGHLDESNGMRYNYKRLYRHIPCVPVDFPTVTAALQKHYITKEATSNDDPFCITLMPGVYNEQIEIDTSDFVHGNTEDQTTHEIQIRAAFPEVGAAIVHYDETQIDQPIVSIRSKGVEDIPDDEGNDEEGIVNVTLHNIQFLHFTRGSDIWNGNCAIQVDGINLSVNISSCSIQSDSGRGLVATRGANINIFDSTIHDCAATGVYIGDLFTSALIERCNVMRNGGGTRSQTQTVLNVSTREDPNNNQGQDLDLSVSRTFEEDHSELLDVVPPGHSGMYLETSTAAVRDCLLMNNSLTGLSVVRGGQIKLSNSDIVGNGSDPITIEDAHDVLLGLGEGIRGGVDDLGGNYCSSQLRGVELNAMRRGRNTMELVRRNAFPITSLEFTTVTKLNNFYS